MTLQFSDGAYNLAAGTRDAFGSLSDDLVREGHPPMTSRDGDREPEDQLRIWYQRMTLTPGNRRVYGTKRWQGRTWYQIHPDSVGIPDTSNHEKRRSNDLRAPYNSNTAAHRRAQVLAKRHNITCEGMGFREWWHWTFWGPLGTIGAPAPAGGASTPEIESLLEDAMANPIIDVDSTLWIGRNDGTFEQYETWKATNSRGIISKVFFGGKGGTEDKIPTLSAADFEVAKTVWRQMCRGTAEAVWSHKIPAQDGAGKPVVPARSFRADGYLASTNAIVNASRES
ncbi:hypothetical protein [Microbacterium sp. Root280D1]|uniref:hypothetical protein n=1 Tax=Microbacterium sp. Root280D1 TaxID=1736510 RepID=UPI0006F4E649|nr:hypothetical protein [Microbacterium sp. Root280D1]KRD51975.1 hypothetical protein ASE34_08645 [Microbacterium sp. Root280D1]